MTPDLERQLAMLGEETLTPLVCKALGDDQAQLVDWSCARLPTDALNPVTAGIFGLSGNAHCRGGVMPWSLVLKVIQRIDLGEAGKGFVENPGDWNYWKREGMVYQSGILDGWRGGMVPVKCYAAAEPTPTNVWIWLEEIREPDRLRWAIGRHLMAARHFGEFNGAHAGYRPSASHDRWLCRRFLRQWTRTLLRWGLAQLARDTTIWAHPYLRLALPPGTERRLQGLVTDSDAFCGLLEQQPWTLSHQDPHWSNLFSIHADGGQERTTVLDWSFLGIAAIGEDLGTQIGGNLSNLNVESAQARVYYEAAFEAYLEGLRQAGWQGDVRRVRFACATAACLRWAGYQVMWLGGCIQAKANGKTSGIDDLARKQGLSIEETLRRWGLAISFLFDVADEARLYAARL